MESKPYPYLRNIKYLKSGFQENLERMSGL